MDVAAGAEKQQFLLHCEAGKKLEKIASTEWRMSGRLGIFFSCRLVSFFKQDETGNR